MNGLILSGGRSARMGHPKALLDYHSKPQYQHAVELLVSFCRKIFISCREEQTGLFAGFSMICDKMEFGEIGPMNGVLSAFEQDKTAWFVLACDYPLLEKTDLEQLAGARDTTRIATVFSNPVTGKPEPLIGIYEAAAGPLLLEWQRLGNQSLRVFLEQNTAQIVVAKNPNHLKSIDTQQDAQEIKHGKSGS